MGQVYSSCVENGDTMTREELAASGFRKNSIPGIDELHRDVDEVASVASDEHQIVLDCRRGKDEIGCGISTACLAPSMRQDPPGTENIFGDLKNSLPEGGPNDSCQLVFQI